MIELVELIAYWSGQLQTQPPMTGLDWHDVCHSTLAYLNAYRATTAMLQDLSKNASDLEEEGRPMAPAKIKEE